MMEPEGWDLLKKRFRRFAPLSEEDFEVLLPHVSLATMPAGALLVQEGKRASGIGFLLAGSMRHYYTHEGLERTTYFYFEGHLVSDYLGCLAGTPAQLTIESLTPCRLLQFPYTCLEMLFKEHHAWEHFGRRLAEYIAMGLEERMKTLLFLSAEARYKLLLAGGKEKIMARIPQHYVASYLGITPVSLSRIRSRLSGR